MLHEQITPVVLTFNEEANIARTLDGLRWARRVVVVDSASTDRTAEICRAYQNVAFHVHPFSSHADQWNHAISETGIDTDWILALDADYVLNVDFLRELTSIGSDCDAFEVEFDYAILGRQLRASLYGPVTVLFRRGVARYVQDGHTQRLVVSGRIGRLQTRCVHDDRKPLGRWLLAQNRYMKLEAKKLSTTPLSRLDFADRIRRLIFVAPIAVLFHVLFVKQTVLDGWPGIFYALQRATAEMILSLRMITELFRMPAASD